MCQRADENFDNGLYRIPLQSLGEKLWWLKFTDTDLFQVNENVLRPVVTVGDMCRALGERGINVNDTFRFGRGKIYLFISSTC